MTLRMQKHLLNLVNIDGLCILGEPEVCFFEQKIDQQISDMTAVTVLKFESALCPLLFLPKK